MSTAINLKSWTEPITYIAGWYLFSLLIVVYNKWMFGPSLGFHFPVIITSFHQLCLFVLSSCALWRFPRYRPNYGTIPVSLSSLVGLSSGNPASTGQKSVYMPWGLYVRKIVPCGIVSAGDIGLSNFSLTLVLLLVYTMAKSLLLAFVLLFLLLFRLEKFRWTLIFIVGLMLVLVVMMVYPEKNAESQPHPLSVLGVGVVILALAVLGLRWLFTQILLKRNEYTSNPFLTIFFISPLMFIVLLVSGMFLEGWGNFTALPVWEIRGTPMTLLLLVIPGVLAFMMTVCEFKLLQVAPVTTMLVAGIFKELITILLLSVIFGDRLSALNWAGLVVTFLDIVWYNFFRLRQQAEEYQPVDQEIEMGAPKKAT